MRKIFGFLTVAVLGLSSLSLAVGPVTSTPLLKTTTTWNGAAIKVSKVAHPEVQSLTVEIPEGSATAWHKHPVNNFAYVISGQLRLELEDKTTHEFKAGEAFAEVVDTWHRGVNVGKGPVKLVVFYTGEVGVPISIPKPAPDGKKSAAH